MSSTDELKEQEAENQRRSAINAALFKEKKYLGQQEALLREQSLQNKQNLENQQVLINQQNLENFNAQSEQFQAVHQQQQHQQQRQRQKTQNTYDEQREMQLMMEQQSLMMRQYVEQQKNTACNNVQQIPVVVQQGVCYEAMMPIRRYGNDNSVPM